MVPGFYFSQISNLKSPIRGFIFRKPGFIFRKISHILVCFYTVNSQKCPKYPKIFARSARGFIFRKSQISNSRFGVLFFANLKYKIPYRGFKKGGGYLHHGGTTTDLLIKTPLKRKAKFLEGGFLIISDSEEKSQPRL